MDLTSFQETAETFANAVLNFPLLIEAVVGTIMLAPFIDAAAQTFGLSSVTSIPSLSSLFYGSSQS